MKVSILTNFRDFHPGYSLTGIVLDQKRMFEEYGDEVDVLSIANGDFPDLALTDYQSIKDLSSEHKKAIAVHRDILVERLKDSDVAFTHDWIFTGWNLPYGLACIEAAQRLPDLKWLHWVHSIPGGVQKDWWDTRLLSGNMKVVYPNKTDALLAISQFRGELDKIRVIPHIKDLRTWFDFSDETQDFIKRTGIMQKDIIQIYPASTDKLESKGLENLIAIFGYLKKLNWSVSLVIANQWTGRKDAEDLNRYKKLAEVRGLIPDKDFIFTSDYGYSSGIPKRMVRELFQMSNLFIFPTKNESFGLILPEAVLAGGVLLVLNRSLDMLREVAGNTGLYFEFGSFNSQAEHWNEEDFLRAAAAVIIGRMEQNESVMSKTFARQAYNWDNLYHRCYLPIIAESTTWK